jgi:predicted glycosyltransferase involved in capsule biosynthesis
MPYCRSWTLNVGARLARGSLLIFHDNDILVPEDYASELVRRYQQGYEVINLKRFVFYLAEIDTKHFFDTAALPPNAHPEAIMQNAEAGGSIAVGRDAFISLGGYDESFIGWGGEDNEFWERAQTRMIWPFGYLPMLHLWHAPQPRKWDPANPAIHLYRERSNVAPELRITELSSRKFGQTDALSIDINQ